MPSGEGHATYFYYAIALFGAAMTPYEVFFFSSGAVEEHWTSKDLNENRANVFIGFPLGAFLSLEPHGAGARSCCCPLGIAVDHLSQAALPVSRRGGQDRARADHRRLLRRDVRRRARDEPVRGLHDLAVLRLAVGQARSTPRCEPVPPRRAGLDRRSRCCIALTAVDPIKVTEYSIVLSAAALPLTYFPILVVANDPDYMGDDVNGRFGNAIASVYFVILVVVSVATIPLMIVTKAGA